MIKNFFKNKKIGLNNGFTVIETLVAITVLLLSIIGPMEIASKGLFAAMYARDEITAFYLGQEAIEYIRNARDTSYIVDNFVVPSPGNSNWLYGLYVCFPFSDANPDGDGCIINTTEPFMDNNNALNALAIEACPNAGCPPLRYSEENGIYNYNSAKPVSKYTRTVKLLPKDNRGVIEEEALIEVTVRWNSGSFFAGQRTFVIRERLLNWRSKD